MSGEAALPSVLRSILERERDTVVNPIPEDIGVFLTRARGFWAGAIRGGGR